MTSAPCTTRLRRAGAVRVVLHVVIRRKKASNLDAATGSVRTFEQKSIVSAFSGRNSSEFGTVRPRVQIPGPRPVFEFRVVVSRLTPGGSTNMLCKSDDCDSKAYFRAVTRLAQPLSTFGHRPLS